MKKILMFIIIGTLFSCKTNYYVKTLKPEEVKSFTKSHISYYLPKTKIIIDLKATKIIKNKGPFSEYADEFLGFLGNVIRENQTYWQITDIQITTQPIRDTNNLWIIVSNYPGVYNINLNNLGFLVGFNLSQPPQDINLKPQTFISTVRKPDTSEKLLVIDRGYKEVYDTFFRVEVYDTIQRTVPIIEKRLIRKSARDQARELADKIFTLRDDREALLVGEGDSEYLPEGSALNIMLKGIDKLEKEYLSQFVGRIDKIQYHYRFEYIPEPKNYLIQEILFRFSPKLGILPPDDLRGDPVILEINSMQTTEPLKDFNSKQDLLQRVENIKNYYNGIVFNIPELVNVKLIYHNQTLFKTDLLITQFGTIGHIPSDVLIQPNIEIQFDPKTGALKSIKYHR